MKTDLTELLHTLTSTLQKGVTYRCKCGQVIVYHAFVRCWMVSRVDVMEALVITGSKAVRKTVTMTVKIVK